MGQPQMDTDYLRLETMQIGGEQTNIDGDDPNLIISLGEMLLLAVPLSNLRILKPHEKYGWLYSLNALYYLARNRWLMNDQAQLRDDKYEARLETGLAGLATELRYVAEHIRSVFELVLAVYTSIGSEIISSFCERHCKRVALLVKK